VAGQLGPIAAAKTALRREILAARDALPATARIAASSHITQQIVALDAWKNARVVLAYLSFGSEFITDALIQQAAADGKQLALPRVDRATRRLAIHAVADMVNDLQAGVWGIREPRAEQPLVALETIDFVLLPGVGFTPRGERLGYGGGFYDRLLERFAQRPPLVAAAYAVQIRAQLPLDQHDRGVDLVFTEDAAYCCC